MTSIRIRQSEGLAGITRKPLHKAISHLHNFRTVQQRKGTEVCDLNSRDPLAHAVYWVDFV